MEPLSHERRILLMAAAAGLPGSVAALALLWTGDYSPKLQWTLTILILAAWSVLAIAIRRQVVFPLQTVSNLLAALREGDRRRVTRRRQGSSTHIAPHGDHPTRGAPVWPPRDGGNPGAVTVDAMVL